VCRQTRVGCCVVALVLHCFALVRDDVDDDDDDVGSDLVCMYICMYWDEDKLGGGVVYIYIYICTVHTLLVEY
jgi:hypothetical protein